jgi:hypothetical protein
MTSGTGEKKDIFPYANKLVYKLGKRSGFHLAMIDVTKIRKDSTADQTLYTYQLVVQRDTPVPVKNMALLEIKMLLDFTRNQGDGSFFDEFMLTNKPSPKLVAIKLLGYQREYFDLQSESITQFYAFNSEQDTEWKDQNIAAIVDATRKRHAQEMDGRNVLMDENGNDVQDYNPKFPQYSPVKANTTYYRGNGAGAGTTMV